MRLVAPIACSAMRKLPSILIAVATLAIAGCGDGGGGDASSPLDEALRYLPADAPFAVAIDTDTEGDQYQAAGDIADRFGAGNQLVEQIEEVLDAGPGEIEKFEAALGNEFVVGSTDVEAFVNQSSDEDESFVGAIQTADPATLDDLLEQENAKEDGESNGATIYKDDDGDDFAVKDDVLIVAGNRQELDKALATREGDDSLTEEDFNSGTEGVPADALLRVYLDVEELLQVDPDAKTALRSKWVDSLTTAGIALTVQSDEVAIDFNLNTDGESLTEADLPIAAGGESPQVLDRDGEIALALRDPGQIVAFAQATAKAIDPEGFSGFEVGKKQIERQLGVDLEQDFFGQMEDGLAISSNVRNGKFGARAELSDPEAFEQTLEEMSEVLPNVIEGIVGEKVGFAKPKAGEDFYAVATADGDQIVYGVVDGVFVLSNAPAIAGSLAADDTRAVPGAEGSVVMSVDAELLGDLLIGQIPGGLGIVDRLKAEIGTRPLDELTGSLESSTEALSGSFKLTLD
jgi:hypothetical protein